MKVDHDEVLMTGENSFIRLSNDGGETLSERLSHWRVLWCPAGPGHALFLQGDLTDGAVRIYSDNVAVARWLQRTIESVLFPAFADTSIPVTAAVFDRDGDPETGLQTWEPMDPQYVASGSPVQRGHTYFSTAGDHNISIAILNQTCGDRCQ